MKYILISIFVFALFHSAHSRCQDSSKCCPGKNNTCKGEDYSARGICYCDEFCVKSGDCCNDYDYYCRKQDCVMTYWTHWSSCSSKCGRGTYERKRNVHIPPSGGGAACDARRQVSYCYGNDRSCGKREVAMVLPTYYKPYRKSNQKVESYCIKYKVTQIAKACGRATPWYLLKKDDEACVECAPPAMKNGKCTGAHVGGESQWMAVQSSKCFGSWQSSSAIIRDCDCGFDHGHDFIFV